MYNTPKGREILAVMSYLKLTGLKLISSQWLLFYYNTLTSTISRISLKHLNICVSSTPPTPPLLSPVNLSREASMKRVLLTYENDGAI